VNQAHIYPPQPALTPGGKRGQTHLELHISYFESLGIPTPAGQDNGKARIWPVLSRKKEKKNQILVHARNQTPPNLPLSIRMTAPPEERWTQDSARKDLILRLEAELEEKILRYKLAVKDNLHLEWCWSVEPSRRGMECTILAHIQTGSNALSVQNKRHLHWKEAKSISKPPPLARTLMSRGLLSPSPMSRHKREDKSGAAGTVTWMMEGMCCRGT